ncbi:MAG: acylneuraminate cytidylyltransferase family protein [Burkholderiaceae bacterium]
MHAKGTSERVPGKNLRRLGDRPLFCHAIAIARASTLVDEVVVDSDSDEILRLGAEHGATPLRRPASLATNATTGDDLAWWQASARPEADFVVQVIPTAPFLSPRSVDAALELLANDASLNSVAGVTGEPLYLWEDGRPAYFLPDGRIPNSSSMRPYVWETTGLYANRAAFVREHRRRMDVTRVHGLVLSKLEALDVNTPEDFEFAELVWRGLHAADAQRTAA